MVIKQRIATSNPCYKSGRKSTKNGCMLHSVGCPQPDPLAFVNYWGSASANVCVHLVVGTKEAYQLLPYDIRAWHCGSGSKGSGNDNLISLEMTEPSSIQYTGGSNWIELGDGSNTKAHVLSTYKNAVEVLAKVCLERGIDPANIISHKEGHAKGIASNHGDVEHIWDRFGLTMNQFRADVQSKVKGGNISVSTVPIPSDSGNQKINPLSGTVTVIYEGSDGINIRKTPSFTGVVNDVVFKSSKYKVVGISEDEKWYKLNTGLYITASPKYVKFKATEEQKNSTAGTGYYRVRKSWDAESTQIGAFKGKKNAISLCKNNAGYKVYDNSGKEVYPCVKEKDSSFRFSVSTPSLKIRKGPGTTYDYHKNSDGNARYTGKGVFTIVKTQAGPGADLWGLLKSYEVQGNGWIALDSSYGSRLV